MNQSERRPTGRLATNPMPPLSPQTTRTLRRARSRRRYHRLIALILLLLSFGVTATWLVRQLPAFGEWPLTDSAIAQYQPNLLLPFRPGYSVSCLTEPGEGDHTGWQTRHALDLVPQAGDRPMIATASASGTAYVYDGCEANDADCHQGFGNHVKIDHGHHLYSLYAHLDKISVKTGQTIQHGQALGLVGQTGNAERPHLHWGLYWGDPAWQMVGYSLPMEKVYTANMLERQAPTWLQSSSFRMDPTIYPYRSLNYPWTTADSPQ